MSATPATIYSFDDELVIETPERVSLYFVLASVGNRFLAAAIDHAIQMVILISLVLVIYYSGSQRLNLGISSNWIAALAIIGALVVYMGYFAIFETIWSGQSPGKRLMRLRVIRDDGRPMGFYEAFVRNLIRLIDMAPPPSYAAGVVSIILSPESRRLGDYVAGTVVIKEREIEAPRIEEIEALARSETMLSGEREPGQLKLDLRTLSVSEIHAINRYLERRGQLAQKDRTEFVSRLAQPLYPKLNISPAMIPPEALLEEISRTHRIRARYRS